MENTGKKLFTPLTKVGLHWDDFYEIHTMSITCVPNFIKIRQTDFSLMLTQILTDIQADTVCTYGVIFLLRKERRKAINHSKSFVQTRMSVEEAASVSYTYWPLYTRGKSLLSSLNRRLGGLPNPSWRLEVKKNLLSKPRIKPRFKNPHAFWSSNLSFFVCPGLYFAFKKTGNPL